MKNHPVSPLQAFTAGPIAVLVASLAFAGCAGVSTQQSTELMSPLMTASTQDNFVLPEPLQTVRPIYPWELKRAGIVGIVYVNCRIDEFGHPHDIGVKNATDEKFIRPTLDAFQHWTFKPAMRDGVPVAIKVTVPVRFDLEMP